MLKVRALLLFGNRVQRQSKTYIILKILNQYRSVQNLKFRENKFRNNNDDGRVFIYRYLHLYIIILYRRPYGA